MFAHVQPRKLPSPRHRSAWRFLWVLLLLLHVPATVKVFSVAIGGESGWSSAVLMTATNLFFLLEIIFGWSLHLLTDRRSAVVFLMIVVLLHAGVIDRALPEFLGQDGVHYKFLLTAGGAAAIRMLLALVQVLVSRLADVQSRLVQLSRRRYASLVPIARACASPRLMVRIRPLRAPPF